MAEVKFSDLSIWVKIAVCWSLLNLVATAYTLFAVYFGWI